MNEEFERGLEVAAFLMADLIRRDIKPAVARLLVRSERDRLAALPDATPETLGPVAEALAAEVQRDRPPSPVDELVQRAIERNRQRAGLADGDLPPANTVEGRIARNRRAAAAPNALTAPNDRRR